MKNLTLIALSVCSLLLTDCKTKSKASSSSNNNSNTTTNSDQGKTLKCKVAIDFISFASGIDGPKYDAIKSYIDKHPKKPAYDEIPMGREGERAFCLSLKEMNSSEQKDFIDQVKKLAEGSDRVKVSENTERVKH